MRYFPHRLHVMMSSAAFSPSNISTVVSSTVFLSVSSSGKSISLLIVNGAVESLQSHVSGASSRITSAIGSLSSAISSAKSAISGPSAPIGTVPPSSEAATMMKFGGVLLAMLAVVVGFVAL